MKRIVLTALCLICGMSAFADEGMWMVNAISRALVQKMQGEGLQMNADEIYSSDKVSLTDAIVSLDFGCTGSMVSSQGLLITNHHCAYHDVHSISTPECNYLEDGFWARQPSEERYIPGKCAYFLEKVLDVTDEVGALIEEQKAIGKPTGSRRISYLMEKKYAAETGLEASLSSMWSGSRYYMALYKVYTDIRLVAAPPVSISAYGGDTDNWEWPQHKCDFAMYRIYAAQDGSPAPHSDANVPMVPKCSLKISSAGYMPGDFAMVIGYPGRTDRYASSAKTEFLQKVRLPITNEIRAGQMKIISRWMDSDPAIRLKYSDMYFSLSNTQELYEGEVQCIGRFKVVKAKRKLERRTMKSPEEKRIVSDLNSKYKAIYGPQKNLNVYRETMIRGTRLAMIATRLKNNSKTFSYEKEYEGIDMRVEKDLLRYCIETYLEGVDSTCRGAYQNSVREMFRKDDRIDYDALCNYLWTDDYLTKEDNLFKFLTEVSISSFNSAADLAQGDPGVSSLGREYTRAMYRIRNDKGELQYPDANSTMRLTFGTVNTFKRDGQKMPWQTFSEEILAKEDLSQHDFTLKDDWRAMLQGQKIPVNFITDNDITGGNSGSPVMNSRGELIGLAFDGNKESLASDVAWTEGYNKCVCVDIRFVLWTLEHYAGMDRILGELTVTQ